MSTSMFKKTLVVAGLIVNVYSNAPLSERGRSLAVLFLLHGRLSSTEAVEKVVEGVLQYAQAQATANREIVVVTFDHRNHGTRLVDPNANDDWKNKNERHAIDMFAIQTGTASDVSFLIDFLPAYLLPSGAREIKEWMVAGISLGGHSTWIVLRDEPRVKIGVPIIGCPDYMALMRPRAEYASLPIASPYFPPSLLTSVKKHDPSSAKSTSRDPAQNSFLGKHILVLSGGKDKLVPWYASQRFVEELEVGPGTKKVVVEDNAGHECTRRMVGELASFVWEHGVQTTSKASY